MRYSYRSIKKAFDTFPKRTLVTPTRQLPLDITNEAVATDPDLTFFECVVVLDAGAAEVSCKAKNRFDEIPLTRTQG
jgi:hypothetical protein